MIENEKINDEGWENYEKTGGLIVNCEGIMKEDEIFHGGS